MSGDLGASAADVHAKARAVLDFWFKEVPEDKHFAKDDALDAQIRERFEDLRREVIDTRAEGWRDRPEHLLAAIILIDQFSRNVHRGEAEAFRGDGLARELVRDALAKGWDEGMPQVEGQFLYMPMMHSEASADQAESIRLFEKLGNEFNLKFARDHAAVIAKFGRFPARNAALGRRSTPEEQEYLSQPGAGW